MAGSVQADEPPSSTWQCNVPARFRALGAVDGQAEQFVLDLSELRYIDCCGARTLAAVTRAVPDECPVIVRSVRPAVGRLLELMGLDLGRPPGQSGAAVHGEADRRVDGERGSETASVTGLRLRSAAAP